VHPVRKGVHRVTEATAWEQELPLKYNLNYLGSLSGHTAWSTPPELPGGF
jgi:hypothetical protein